MPPEITNQPESTSGPKKSVNISVPAAIVTGAAIIALAIIFTLGGSKGTTQNQQANTDTAPKTVAKDVATVREEDYVRGNADAEVVVIEYSDSDCPFCKQFHDTMKQTVDAYQGKVAWAYRFFPLTQLHPNAYTEAIALYCVGELGGDAAFWPYLDTIIATTLTPDAKSNEALISNATKVGIDKALFQSCVESPNASARIDAEIAEAQKSGARGTPYSIAVNQKTGKQVVIPGAVPADYMKQVIDSLLK